MPVTFEKTVVSRTITTRWLSPRPTRCQAIGCFWTSLPSGSFGGLSVLNQTATSAIAVSKRHASTLNRFARWRRLPPIYSLHMSKTSKTADKRGRADLELFLLALLSRGIATPYDLQAAAGLSPGASIPALGRLEAAGYVVKGEQ